MARKPYWRDSTKLSKAGYLLPRFRISLPSGDAVVEHSGLSVGTPIQADSFRLRCSNMGIYDVPLKATDPIDAQKEAVVVLRKRFAELQSLCVQNLEALTEMPPESFAVADESLFYLAPATAKDCVKEEETGKLETKRLPKQAQKEPAKEKSRQEKKPREKAATPKKKPQAESSAKPKRTRRKTEKE